METRTREGIAHRSIPSPRIPTCRDGGHEHSADDADIDIQATVASEGRADEILETIVADLTHDVAVTAASWKIRPFNEDESALGALTGVD